MAVYLGAHKNVGMYPDSSACTFTLGEGESGGREGWWGAGEGVGESEGAGCRV